MTDAERKRNQRKLKRAQDALWDETMGTMPDHIIVWNDALPGNLDEPVPPEPWTRAAWARAARHLVRLDFDAGPDAEPYFDTALHSRTAILAASRSRSERESELMGILWREYPDLWGKRGAAKIIASLAAEAGYKVSERTVQRYFRMHKLIGKI